MTEPKPEPPICARLRRDEHRGRFTLGGGTIDATGKGTMWGGERIMELVNPDGSEAAAIIKELLEALEECQDKLWVLHFSLNDEAERSAAINACNMASAAIVRARGQP